MTSHRRRWGIAAGLTALVAAITLAGPASSPATATAATIRPVLGIAAGGTLQWETPAQQDAYLSTAQDLGATWLRFDFAWSDIQRANSATFDWGRYESLVAKAAKHGMRVAGTIAYTPAWARDPACSGDQTCRPRSATEFAAFAGQVAAHFAPRGVHDWEIWNEPNHPAFFKPAPDAGVYTNLLKGAYSAIHAADAQAVVITGGMSPAATGGGDISPIDFVTRMYAAGAGGHFDALGHHPYCFAASYDCPGTNATWSAWTQMSGTATSLRSLMTAHGDGAKQLWATEFGAPTNGDSSAVTEAHQATMLRDGLTMFGGYSWSGPLFLYSLQDRGTNKADREDWFGVVRTDGSHKPAFAAMQSVLRSAVAAPAATTPAPAATTPAPVATTVTPVATTPAPVATAPASAPPPPSWTSFWSWLFGHHPWG